VRWKSPLYRHFSWKSDSNFFSENQSIFAEVMIDSQEISFFDTVHLSILLTLHLTLSKVNI